MELLACVDKLDWLVKVEYDTANKIDVALNGIVDWIDKLVDEMVELLAITLLFLTIELWDEVANDVVISFLNVDDKVADESKLFSKELVDNSYSGLECVEGA